MTWKQDSMVITLANRASLVDDEMHIVVEQLHNQCIVKQLKIGIHHILHVVEKNCRLGMCVAPVS